MRKINIKHFGPDCDGKFYEYFEGFCDSSEVKPTELVADGSQLIESDTGDWWFFNEKTQTWIPRLNIEG